MTGGASRGRPCPSETPCQNKPKRKYSLRNRRCRPPASSSNSTPVSRTSSRWPSERVFPCDDEAYYDWFRQEQIAWLRTRCEARTAANGRPSDARRWPSSISHCPNTPRHGGTPTTAGSAAPPRTNAPGRSIRACSPRSSKRAASWPPSRDTTTTSTIWRPTGNLSRLRPLLGRRHTYNNLRPGVRLLVLTEGERGFETWIREDDGRKVDHARFADGRITEIPAKR